MCAEVKQWVGHVCSGAGGASKAFLHADGRRMREIEVAIGCLPVPGSLNVLLDESFDWLAPHVVAVVLDVVERGKGLDVPWYARTARLYPVTVAGAHGGPAVPAWVFRFDGEKYKLNFVELVAPQLLRDVLGGQEEVTLCLV